jgi:hypothetical protein
VLRKGAKRPNEPRKGAAAQRDAGPKKEKIIFSIVETHDCASLALHLFLPFTYFYPLPIFTLYPFSPFTNFHLSPTLPIFSPFTYFYLPSPDQPPISP